MPGKSRRVRKLSRGKKMKTRQASMVALQQQAAQPHEPAAPLKVSPPPVSVPKSAAPRYPYITTELRKIAILAVIMLIILVVVTRVLP